ncbi:MULTISPECIES: hypothetical protein [unclassified Frankia]|uniref:HD domain-containing protein n=1 Tax=unclassified Frankia TaxID=2632575 RepID=UPI002AD20BA9|nr:MULTISPECIES: hypothetical protein [unclassified Frankia]
MGTVVLSPLARSFDGALLAVGARADEAGRAAAFADLARRYCESGRYYHTLRHVGETLTALQVLVAADRAWDQPTGRAGVLSAVAGGRLAIFFHDAVYDTCAGDNEARSGELAVATLTELGCPRSVIRDVDRLVRATGTHVSAEPDEAMINDADLRVLARPAPAYDVYVRRVRREYGWASPEQWVAGRVAVLRALLDCRVYATPWAFHHWEPAARANLRRELADLRRVR